MNTELRELLEKMRNLELGYDRKFAAGYCADELFNALPALIAQVEELEAVARGYYVEHQEARREDGDDVFCPCTSCFALRAFTEDSQGNRA